MESSSRPVPLPVANLFLDDCGSVANTQLSEFDRCASESLHTSGQIQPHGLLFAISEPDFIVRHVSANVSFLLGMSVETVLGQSFKNVLGSPRFEAFQCQLRDDAAALNPPRFRVGGNDLEVECVAHRRDGWLILELELLAAAQSLAPLNLNTHIGLPLARMQQAGGIPELLQMAVSEIRRLSGFNHVMVYQLDGDWNSVVSAEARDPSAIAHLGLRFPASAMPAQTRRPFPFNRMLAIVDIQAAPVPVVAEIGPLTETELDLTGSLLRLPESAHLEQLRSMGVRASLTIPISVGHNLWGLIACHHPVPRHVDYSIRSVCELIAQMLGSQLALRLDNSALELQLVSRSLLNGGMTPVDEPESLVHSDYFQGSLLLHLFSADGLLLRLDGVVSSQGLTVEAAALWPLINKLRQLSSCGIASSNMLSAPEFSAGQYAGEVSGGLYVGLSEETDDYLLLLRRECEQTIGGSRSRPWSDLDLENARFLRERFLRLKAQSKRLHDTAKERNAPESHGAPKQSSVSILHQNAILNSTNVSIIAGNSEGLITVFNSGAEQMLGYTAEEIVGKQTPCIFHLDSEVIARGEELAKETGRLVSSLDVVVASARAGQPEEREWTYVRKDGVHLTVNEMVTPLRDSSGASIGFLGVAMDVTARKKAETAARARDEHYRLIVETVGDYALIMLDASGRVTSWNTGAQRMKGYQASEIIGQHFSRFYLPEDIERCHPESELRIAAKQGRYSEQGWRVRKDGSRFFADVAIAAMHDDAGHVTGFAKVVHDITERKQTEDRFQLVVEAAPSAMVMVGENGLISLVNTQSERLFGYDRREMLGRPIEMLLPERFRSNPGDPSAGFFRAPAACEMGVGTDLFGLRCDGSEVPLEISLNSISTPGGELVLASIIDITARKAAERDANERTKQLRLVNKELAEFAYVASHDLKAPLRVIDNASKWLEEDLAEHLTDETRGTLKLLQGRVRRMDKLLDDLLEYARIGRGSDNRYTELISGDVLMDDVLGLLAAENFALTVSPAFAGIHVCRMPLQQILMNLIGNAIKHHDKKKGRIDVTVEDNGPCYAFAVKDDGPGIHPRFHDEVFKMFQTLRPRDQVEGSGMGLALVRKNIEVFGGVIQLESAEGQGSIFRFTWPKQQQVHREPE